MNVRRLLKILGVVLVWLAVVAGLAYGGLVVVSNGMVARGVRVPVSVQPIVMREGDAGAIARGRYLAEHLVGCPVCHAADFGGRAEIDDPAVGTLWAPNLTLGAGSAVAQYTPVDWARAIRHGVAPDGHRLLLMPSEEFFKFSDEDLGAVVSYIKSVPNVDREDRGIRLGPVGRMLLVTGQVRFAFDKIDHAEPRPAAAIGATREWGSVLIGACQGCHGPTLSGGKIPGTPPEWPAARNLTPHPTGLRDWTYGQFVTLLRTGRRPDGTEISPVMPWKAYAGMTETDIRALWEYLRTVTPKPAGGR